MVVKNVIDEDFLNYKKPAMFIGFPSCSFKCDKECGRPVCQNSALASAPNIDIATGYLVQRFLNNPITCAIVCGGLEPFDSPTDLLLLIRTLRRMENERHAPNADFVIYTGYTEHELLQHKFQGVLAELHRDSAVFIKFGRYVPGDSQHFDDVLGVMLSSDNQYAKRI